MNNPNFKLIFITVYILNKLLLYLEYKIFKQFINSSKVLMGKISLWNYANSISYAS